MINLTDFMRNIVKEFLATKDPAEKAAIIADFTLRELPERVVFVARRCIIFHWFDQSIIEVLLKKFNLTQDEIRNVYEQLEALPFIEKLPWGGLTFQDSTREGLLKRYASLQPDLLKSAALQAASVYEAHNDDKVIAEAAFCHILAHNELIGKQLIDKLTKRALERGDQQFIDNLQSLLNEAKNIVTYSSVIPKTMKNIFYKTGGALLSSPPDSEIYVERAADARARMYLQRMDYITLIEPRQQGKTSLINQLMGIFIPQGYIFAYIDLTTITKRSSESIWYQTIGKWLLDRLYQTSSLFNRKV